MIAPEKLSKSLGNKKLSIGLSTNELIVVSCIPLVGHILKVNELYSILSLIILSFLLSLKNKNLENKFLKNFIEFEESQDWEKVRIKHD